MPGYSQMMFEKRMREKNMGMDPMGNFKGPMMPEPPQVQSGFDNSSLMQDPRYKQMDTMNQGMEVSKPYFEANEKAFEKNNPMNAASQETPVGDRVSEFLKRIGGGTADFMTGGMTDFDGRSR